MASQKKIFLEDSELAFDKKHRRTINFNVSRYDVAIGRGKFLYKNMDLVNGTGENQMVKTYLKVLGEEKEFTRFAKNSFSKTRKSNLNK